MNSSVIITTMQSTILEAAQLMSQNKLGSLPVTDDSGYLAGMITDTDIVRKIAAKNIDPETSLVKTFMTREIKWLNPESTLAEATDLMVKYKFKRIPIMEGSKIKGIISATEIMNILMNLNNLAYAEKIIEMLYEGSGDS